MVVKSTEVNSPSSQKLKPSTIRIGTRYRANRLKGPYDAIVIGSGIGGLTTAACLAKAGKKVLVLEQHYTAGGYTHSYARNGYEWDVGVHYIGDMGSPHTLGRRLFDYITDGKLEWAPMDENYDRFFLGEKVVNLRAGKEGLRLSLLDAFPDEQEAIDQYVKLLGKVADGMQWYTLSKLAPGILSPVINKGLDVALPDCFNKTTWEVLSELTDNQELIGAITGQWGDYGLPPAQSSFAIHAMVVRHYFRGGAYPIGGASRIADTIAPIIQRVGGQVVVKATVASIDVEKGRAVGVSLEDGRRFRAPIVISGAGYLNTVQHLLQAEVAEKHGLRALQERIPRSGGHICLYLGFKESATDLRLPKANYWKRQLYLPKHLNRLNSR